jgi:hypothetical protein
MYGKITPKRIECGNRIADARRILDLSSLFPSIENEGLGDSEAGRIYRVRTSFLSEQVELEPCFSLVAIACAGREFTLAIADDVEGFSSLLFGAEIETGSFGATRHSLINSCTEERSILLAEPMITVSP